MPPKKSNLHHIAFHFFHSAIHLSVPSSTSLASLKSDLLPAFAPLASTIPDIPQRLDDFRLYEEREDSDESQIAHRDLEEEGKTGMSKSIAVLGWPKWKKVFVRGEDGQFHDPIYTIPDVDDEVPEDGEVEE